MRPLGILNNLGACIDWNGTQAVMLFLCRDHTAPAYEGSHLTLVRQLVPHLQRVVAIRRRLDTVELQRAAACDALDRLSQGVFFLDAAGGVLMCNAAGREIIEQKDGLELRREGLSVADPIASAALQRLVREACATGTGVGYGSGGALAVSRRSGRPAFAVLIAPLPRSTSIPQRHPVAVVFVGDPLRGVGAVADVLRQVHGLTRAEARLVELLLGGLSLEAVSERLGVTKETGRTHLKRILPKVGARSQADLMRIVLRGVAAFDARNVPHPGNAVKRGAG
jgi:DNA-binding CsgD family transcriptional regulator